MGQQEVNNILKKHSDEWLTTKEISDVMKNFSYPAISYSLGRMRANGGIHYRNGVKKGKHYVYEHKYKGEL